MEVDKSTFCTVETQESPWPSFRVRLKAWEKGRSMIFKFQFKSWQVWGPGKLMLQSKSKGPKDWCLSSAFRQEEFPIIQSFVLFRSSIDWMRSTFIRERTLLFWSTDSHVNLIQEHPDWHTYNNVLLNVWTPHGPVKLTHTIDYYQLRGKRNFLKITQMSVITIPQILNLPLVSYYL
jgi:hypothetical protein